MYLRQHPTPQLDNSENVVQESVSREDQMNKIC